MGYHQFIRAVLVGEPIQVCGDGQQVRGNTFVSDCVEATLAAVHSSPGEIYNVGGGEAASLWEIVKRIESITGRQAVIARAPARPGDQRYAFADTAKLQTHFGWSPKVNLEDGLARQVEWQRRELSLAN